MDSGKPKQSDETEGEVLFPAGEDRGAAGFLARIPVFWRFQIMVWGTFAFYAFLARASFWQSYLLALALTVLLEPVAVLISTGLRHLYLRLGLKKEEVVKFLVVIVVCSGVAAVLQLIAANGILELLAWSGLMGKGSSRLASRLGYYWMVFGSWSFGYLWLKAEVAARTEREHRRSAAAAAQRTEVEMLRLQLNPHFLFNSLNNIASEIPDNPGTAVEMTHQLADYLRYSFDHQGDLVVSLSREVEAMKNYLAIERGRYTDRLKVRIEEAGEALSYMVPSFLLQPLVENAVKHGIATSRPPWELSVDIHRGKDKLHIQVRNSGMLREDEARSRGSGTGVRNLRRRLALHYPGRHAFKLSQQEGQVVADLTLEGQACLM